MIIKKPILPMIWMLLEFFWNPEREARMEINVSLSSFDEAVNDLHMDPSDLLSVLEGRTRKHLRE